MNVPRTCNCTNFNWETTGEPTEFGKLIKQLQDVSFEILKAKSSYALVPTIEKQAEIETLLALQIKLRKELAELK